ncbi:hypothetical protein [Janthinobacterium sp. LM6]|uniref:hypothetical protein n=1 Tax=Janthinobacterium sp. LM6 TaxID=1938606 RepID=UPI001237587B|nr:hypothetical protein [Janthinobacterium sp. LM6]
MTAHTARHYRKCVGTKSLTARLLSVYPENVAKKEATGFDSPIRQRRTSATRRYFFVRTITSPMSGNGGEASACRFPLSPVCQPRHLLLTPFDSGLRGSTTDKEAIMPGTATPLHSPLPSITGTLSVDQLFQTAFYNGRTPRSVEYKAGARMALEHRIEHKDLDMPYQAGTAAADAFFAGIEEGKTIWRTAIAKIGGAA